MTYVTFCSCNYCPEMFRPDSRYLFYRSIFNWMMLHLNYSSAAKFPKGWKFQDRYFPEINFYSYIYKCIQQYIHACICPSIYTYIHTYKNRHIQTHFIHTWTVTDFCHISDIHTITTRSKVAATCIMNWLGKGLNIVWLRRFLHST